MLFFQGIFWIFINYFLSIVDIQIMEKLNGVGQIKLEEKNISNMSFFPASGSFWQRNRKVVRTKRGTSTIKRKQPLTFFLGGGVYFRVYT